LYQKKIRLACAGKAPSGYKLVATPLLLLFMRQRLLKSYGQNNNKNKKKGKDKNYHIYKMIVCNFFKEGIERSLESRGFGLEYFRNYNLNLKVKVN
jgi:hypothetical protein